MEKKEILASQIELQFPIEILNPRATRYTVGQKFSKIAWDPEMRAWKVYSRQSPGRVAIISEGNLKGVLLLEREFPDGSTVQDPTPVTVAKKTRLSKPPNPAE